MKGSHGPAVRRAASVDSRAATGLIGMSQAARPIISQAIASLGAAEVARRLDVSRAALVNYCAGACRSATKIVIEQRAARLGDQAQAQASQP
ncbi:MAG: hypothetical protein JOZ69_18805 [Myxococcales bacterium]|nr:hypothetical protein [Myxococcales bacterium]